MAVWVHKTSWSTRSPLSFKRLFRSRTVSGYGYICCYGCDFACFYNLPIAFWKTRQTPLTSTLLRCFNFAVWILFTVLKMKINEIVRKYIYIQLTRFNVSPVALRRLLPLICKPPLVYYRKWLFTHAQWKHLYNRLFTNVKTHLGFIYN
jgi:hypothetical protein